MRKYIGAYAAVMGGVDAIAFTGGVGENSATIRQACLERLEFLGAALDEGETATRDPSRSLRDLAAGSRVKAPGGARR